MRIRRWLVLGFSLITSACTVGEPRIVSADDPLPADLTTGDVVQRGLLQVAVPEPGQEINMIAELDDGSFIELGVRNPLGGAVELMMPPPMDPLVLASGTPGQCDDGAYSLLGHKVNGTLEWSFYSGSTPSASSVTNVETGLKNSAAAIVNSRNSCGLADYVSATQQYLGRTTSAPNIKNDAGTILCTQMDGKNVVGFGSLPKPALGVACTWSGGGIAADSDIRLSNQYSWFALDVPSGCSGKFGVENVATHEFGHLFGLGHVSESSHPNLTMSTATSSCTNSQLTLGLGDVRGLRALY